MTEHVIQVTTTGSAGSATGATESEDLVYGFIEAIKLDYHASAPATTDLTIAEVEGMARTLFTRTNSATDGTFYPLIQAQDTTGTNITGVYSGIYVEGVHLNVSLAQSDALTNAVVVRILLSDGRLQ